MPIYAYQALATGCGYCEAGFDQLQKLADPELSQCPRCGAGVQRLLSAPALAIGGQHLLNEKRLGDKGFTQYRKIGKGVYEKTAGKGPGIIRGD